MATIAHDIGYTEHCDCPRSADGLDEVFERIEWRHAMLDEARAQTAALLKVTEAIERLEARFPHVPAILGRRRG